MTAVIQRVTEASVTIDGEIHSSIKKGYLVLLGIKKGDNVEKAILLARKIIDLRIFQDENDKMNLGLKDVNGEVLLISQFTLCTDKEKRGNRPSFILAEQPEIAGKLYERVVDEMKSYYDSQKIKTGVFAADMKLKLVNDGPVTIILEKE